MKRLRCILFGHAEMVPMRGMWAYDCQRCVRCGEVQTSFYD